MPGSYRRTCVMCWQPWSVLASLPSLRDPHCSVLLDTGLLFEDNPTALVEQDWDALDSSDDPSPDEPSQPNPSPLSPQQRASFTQVFLLLSTVFTTLASISPEVLGDWAQHLRYNLVRTADRLNIVRVWFSALVGNIWMILFSLESDWIVLDNCSCTWYPR